MTESLFEPLIPIADELCQRSVAIAGTVSLLYQYGDTLPINRRVRISKRLREALDELRQQACEACYRVPLAVDD